MGEKDEAIKQPRTNMHDFAQVREGGSGTGIIEDFENGERAKDLESLRATLEVIVLAARSGLGSESRTVLTAEIKNALKTGLENKALRYGQVFERYPQADGKVVKKFLRDFCKAIR